MVDRGALTVDYFNRSLVVRFIGVRPIIPTLEIYPSVPSSGIFFLDLIMNK